MNQKGKKDDLNRRQFLQASVKLTASAMFLSLGGSRLLGSTNTGTPENTIPSVTLNNGLRMPWLGLGTMTLNGDPGVKCVADAISLGYRLIDTAMIYGNEVSVGEGIKQSGIKRQELFITSKLWKTDMGYEQAKKGFQTSLDKLGTDYLDLYLIHRPSGGDWQGSWRAMEELYHQGKIKAIIAKDLPLGTHPIAGVNVQVKSGSKLFQKAEFETKYTPEDHPEYYAPTVDITKVKESFAPIELDQFYKEGASSVVIPKRKV